MQSVSLEELRELGVRSRRSQRRGSGAILAILLAIPVQFALAPRVGASWAAVFPVIVGGLAFVTYAYAAGQERGAYRRVFRRIAEDKKKARSGALEESPA